MQLQNIELSIMNILQREKLTLRLPSPYAGVSGSLTLTVA